MAGAGGPGRAPPAAVHMTGPDNEELETAPALQPSPLVTAPLPTPAQIREALAYLNTWRRIGITNLDGGTWRAMYSGVLAPVTAYVPSIALLADARPPQSALDPIIVALEALVYAHDLGSLGSVSAYRPPVTHRPATVFADPGTTAARYVTLPKKSEVLSVNIGSSQQRFYVDQMARAPAASAVYCRLAGQPDTRFFGCAPSVLQWVKAAPQLGELPVDAATAVIDRMVAFEQPPSILTFTPRASLPPATRTGATLRYPHMGHLHDAVALFTGFLSHLFGDEHDLHASLNTVGKQRVLQKYAGALAHGDDAPTSATATLTTAKLFDDAVTSWWSSATERLCHEFAATTPDDSGNVPPPMATVLTPLDQYLSDTPAALYAVRAMADAARRYHNSPPAPPSDDAAPAPAHKTPPTRGTKAPAAAPPADKHIQLTVTDVARHPSVIEARAAVTAGTCKTAWAAMMTFAPLRQIRVGEKELCFKSWLVGRDKSRGGCDGTGCNRVHPVA